MSFFTSDILATSTVMSFLNFRDQAKLAMISRAASTIASKDSGHKVIREFAYMHMNELKQFYKNNVLKYDTHAELKQFYKNNVLKYDTHAKEKRLLVAQTFYFKRVLEKQRTHFKSFEIMVCAYLLTAINAKKQGAIDRMNFAISLLDSFPLDTRFSMYEIDEIDYKLVRIYKKNGKWKVPDNTCKSSINGMQKDSGILCIPKEKISTIAHLSVDDLRSFANSMGFNKNYSIGYIDINKLKRQELIDLLCIPEFEQYWCISI